MEFRILGSLQVLDEGQLVDVGAAKQRALLAVLLLNANRVVSRDKLIEALWGERAPGTAQKALGVYVSQLRKALGRDRILTRPTGYEIGIASAEFDLARFEELISERRLAEALRLWRGHPLADFAYEPFAQPEIARLEELRLACLEERVDHDLARGRHAALVGELEALVHEHPVRERLRGQLMLALYRSGRQAEALEAYQAGRALLSEELGLQPSAELKELQRAILGQDPSLAGDEPGPPEEPSAAVVDEALPAPPQVTREVRKTVTVLVCDVIPTYQGLDPESLRNMVARWHEDAMPLLERHGATIERSIGGVMTAIFGIPAVHEDDALRAVHAAAEMRQRLDVLRGELEVRWGAWLQFRGGIATGGVVTGGNDGRPFATGAPVEAAFALHRSAGPGEVLLDERTRRLVRDAVEADDIDGRTTLRSMRPAAPGHESRFDSPMVGRARELRRLGDAFEQAVANRRCQLYTILGSPGVGKSRLVREFIAGVTHEALVVRGRCLPYGEGITYWPVVEAVRDAAGLVDAESSEESMAKLLAVLEGEEDAELVGGGVGEVLGLAEETTGAEEVFWAVRSFFEALSRRHSLVVVFDDVHWGEPTFLDLVDHIADLSQEAPMLLVCLARPELLDIRSGWAGGKMNATTALLEPLSKTESQQLVDNLTETAGLDEGDRRRIVEAAGGNPLFVEELLALVLDEDADASVNVPPTIQALLAARLDRLASDERTVIEAASVEGGVFHEGSIAELIGVTPAEVHDHLLTLVRRELVKPDRPVFARERGYQFRHLLIRDAAYDSISKEARAVLHERHARWLQRKAGDRALEFEEILGYHLEQAFRYRADLRPPDDAALALARLAAEQLGAAGRRAFARVDTPAAMKLTSRAVSLLPVDDSLRVDLIPSTRAIQGFSGDLSWAERALREASEAGDDRLKGRAMVQRGFLRLFTEDVSAEELLAVAQDSMLIAGRVGDQLGLARAWRLAGQAHYLARRATQSLDAGERALEHARAAGDRFEVIEVVEWLLVLLLFGPVPAGAVSQRCRQLRSEVPGEHALEAMTAVSIAWSEAARGSADEAKRLLGEARSAMQGHGEVVPFVLLQTGLTLMLLDDLEAAASNFEEGFEFLRKRGRTGHYAACAVGLAEVRYRSGRYDEANDLIDEASRWIRPNDVWDKVHCDSGRAKVLARRGDLEAAERIARQAVSFVSESDFLTARADAMSDLAEVLRLAGRNEEAARALEEAIELFERKGNVVAARQARDVLGRLGT